MKFKNKSELINFIKFQTGVELSNEEITLNEKRNLLYTSINRINKNKVLGLLQKYSIRYESHIGDNYFIFTK